jgi:tetratricopeptide (TPR) repeat protein
VAARQGDYRRAVALYEESLGLLRALGKRRGIAWSLNDLGLAACMQGDHARALALCEEALALSRELGAKWGIANSLNNLGTVVYRQGDYARVRALVEESLLLSRDIGARDLVATGLECLAWVAAAHGQPQQAAWLGGAAEELRQALGVPLLPEQRSCHDEVLQAMRAALGQAAFAAAWAEGRALPLEAAIASALEHCAATGAVAI